MFKIKIAHSPAEVERIIDLSVKILRKPWNQPAETATDNLEVISINIYIENEKKEIVACGRLQENENKVGQIRFMAVDDKQQGKGLGKMIVNALEMEGKKLISKPLNSKRAKTLLSFIKAADIP